MFEGFETSSIDVGETTIFIRRKGNGRPLLLLHGFPETHLMWHDVASALAQDFTIVCADLRGYGASGKARDLVCVMDQPRFRRFCVAGHDRGGRIAYRMALDQAARVERLAVL